ncbi:MAG: hypothetical protein ACI8PZ_005978 [Myxococcota bacterium]|jgi:hypothetical protein
MSWRTWAPTLSITDRAVGKCRYTEAPVLTATVDDRGRLLTSLRGDLDGDASAFFTTGEPPSGVFQRVGLVNLDLSSRVTFCLGPTLRAAQADFYFWWARRLLFWARRCASPWYAFMAVLAARTALRGVVDLASTLLHEYAHGSAPNLGGSYRDHCTDRACCYDRAEEMFKERLVAELALPRGDSNPSPFVDEWDVRNAGGPRSRCGDKSGFSVIAKHCNVFKQGHFLETSVATPTSCLAGSALASDSVRAFGAPADCPPEPFTLDRPQP